MNKTKKVKEQNQESIYQLLRTRGELTKQDIAQELNLSMPTTLQNVNEMLERGFLEECGVNESTGGRKAKRIRLVRDIGFALGIEVALHYVEITITDFVGNLMTNDMIPLVFRDEPEWYRHLGDAVQDVLKKYDIKTEKLLGVGISFPGIINAQTDFLTRSHILHLEYMSLDRFRTHIPYPLRVYNDANCAGFSEVTPERGRYLYLSLNETVGGALLEDGHLFLGDTFQAGEVGHVVLHPHGIPCYCGKIGCADSYLSSNVLKIGNRSLSEFFLGLQSGQEELCKTWDGYLENLAILITNLRMVCDEPVIVGGEVGGFMESYLDKLKEKAEKYDLFARDIDYIYPCHIHEHACSIGAARLALEEFGNDVFV
ncbi:MAG: ROK family transcriptional regulator [Clostridiales bacterium]|nr:ROK family transcriptional regulator [Clostridiales bacterium]